MLVGIAAVLIIQVMMVDKEKNAISFENQERRFLFFLKAKGLSKERVRQRPHMSTLLVVRGAAVTAFDVFPVVNDRRLSLGLGLVGSVRNWFKTMFSKHLTSSSKELTIFLA